MSLKYQSEELNPEQQPENLEANAAPVESNVPWYSIALIASYTAVFIAQLACGIDQSAILAGDDKDAVLHRYEFWRMLTGTALHGGLLHYALNSYAFYSFGRIFEMLASRANLAIVFLISAISGSIFSLVINPHGISVGASGGIVGLVGYLAVYSFKRRAFITPAFRRSLIINIVIILFYGLVLSVRVDNAAHIGGLIAGAIYGLAQIPSDSYSDPREASEPVRLLGYLSLAIYVGACLFGILVITQVV